jgi:hypothetical protein
MLPSKSAAQAARRKLCAHSPGPEIPDLALLALPVGQPFRAKQFFSFPPMLQGAVFRATLFLPNGACQRLNVLLLPGLHNLSTKLIANSASSRCIQGPIKYGTGTAGGKLSRINTVLRREDLDPQAGGTVIEHKRIVLPESDVQEV